MENIMIAEGDTVNGQDIIIIKAVQIPTMHKHLLHTFSN